MITAKFPFQVEIVEGKKYARCKCGLSKKQVRLTNLIIPCIMYVFMWEFLSRKYCYLYDHCYLYELTSVLELA